MVKEGDQVVFATDDDNERTLWVQAIYRATGQSHKPTPPATHQPSKQPVSNTQISRMKVGKEPRRRQRSQCTRTTHSSCVSCARKVYSTCA